MMKKAGHFIEETLPGQFLATACALAAPFLALVLAMSCCKGGGV